MNRNVESHFANLPSIDIQRSIFDRSSTHKTSFDSGNLVPIYIDEVLPGDSFQMTTSKVVRAQTMLTPIMDNIYLDTYFFFVPLRLIWDHAKEFFGENNTSAWVQQTQYTIPSISSPASTGFTTGTIADYMGLPVGVVWNATDRFAPSALPIRAYAKICDEWFRDENITDPLNIPTGDSNQTGTNGTSYINDVANGGAPFKVAKYHDYFTSALPSAQKATKPVSFNLLNDDKAPVVSYTDNIPSSYFGSNTDGTRWLSRTGTGFTGNHPVGLIVDGNGDATLHSYTNSSAGSGSGYALVPANLWADLSTSLGAITINDLRLAFQLQKFYERQARGGSRYIEILKSHFGVTSPDARLQRTEYLGGNRIPLNIHEVTNSAQSQNDFLGDLGAKSATSDIHEDFEHSFTEHGYIIGVCCVRYDHSYPQGLEKFWTRKSFEEFYWPEFSNLGETPIWDCEIYADATTLANETVFGYQEYAADYRYKPDRVSGEMRPGISNTLASWHLADYYNAKPTLSDGWIREDKTNIDRTLAVTSAVSNQFFADFYFKCICTRPMPTYSIPGLIDHH